jgi:hypothetical protein
LPESTDFTSTFTCGSTDPTSVTRTCTSATSALAVRTLSFSSARFVPGRAARAPAPARSAMAPIQRRLLRFPLNFFMDLPFDASPL